MTKPILVAVDPFREDPDPLAFASLLSRLTGRRVVAVGAYLDAVLPSRVNVPAYRRAVRDLASKGLEWAQERLPDGAETLAVPGDSRPRALLDATQELDAAMLVLGSAHHGPVGRVVTGSVTDHLLHGAACPIAITPRGYEAPGGGLRRVGAAFVDTPEGQNALRGAVALARRAGASLQAITVIHPIGWGTMAVPRATAIAREQQETRRAAVAALDQALAGVDPAVAAEPVVVENGVAGALETVSSQLDVLVCGSRGYGPVKTVLLGSVSRALSQHSHCPLIVLPRGAGQLLEQLMTGPARRSEPVAAGDGE